MSIPTTDLPNPNILHSVVEHVFMPPKLPQSYPGESAEREINVLLCDSLINAAQNFLQVLPYSQRPLWVQMINMMELARRAAEDPLIVVELQRVFLNMATGGTYKYLAVKSAFDLTILHQMYFACISVRRTLLS
jgi:hypothetical protein